MEKTTLRVLCPKFPILSREPGLQWLVGSPFFPRFTLLSTFRCIHTLPQSPFSPDLPKEAEDLRMLIPKGFEIIGALAVDQNGSDERIAHDAVDVSDTMRRALIGEGNGSKVETRDMIGAVGEYSSGEVRFFVSKSGKSAKVEPFDSVVYGDFPQKYVWGLGCLLLCKVPIELPVYVPDNGELDANEVYSRVIKAASDRFKDPKTVYVAEAFDETSSVKPRPLLIEMNFDSEMSNSGIPSESAPESITDSISCSYFCSQSPPVSSSSPIESADIIKVSVLENSSCKSSESAAPLAEYIPAPEEVHFSAVQHELEVLCYAPKDLSLIRAVTSLIIPALVDQLDSVKNATDTTLLTQNPRLRSYHFMPPGVGHPITVIYELSHGETELKQVEVRKSLHLRMGLPLDRPLLRVANALNFDSSNDSARSKSITQGPLLLKDVHVGIPSSGVSGGLASLIQGSYEYHHYLQDGFDDSGWGCAYRSLQTIVSWFKLQHYTSVDAPSHREIQQALVEIGDKDPSFIGSREWIGAIELSFVLDKLLGVSCKVINVRFGAELPEKCRELALHFENQGTPIMIGGGVLAYTLLGVDFNEVTGVCAFLILDPHYTGNDERKKIINGGWCGWKKAIDSRGKHFFLQDKFYNLLLPQRPNVV